MNAEIPNLMGHAQRKDVVLLLGKTSRPLRLLAAPAIPRLIRLGCFSLVALATVGLCILIADIIYKLHFHPLAKYPGPFLAKLTNLYAAYHSWKGDIPLDQWRCHQKYGPRVRYAPNKVMFNTAASLTDIYGHSKNVIKGESYQVAVHRAPNTVTARDRREHGRKRRVVSQGFSGAALKSYEPAILQHMQRFCRLLPLGLDADAHVNGTGWSQPQNMARWCDYFAFDVMAEVIFGMAYNLMEKPDHRYVLDAIGASNVRIGSVGHAPELLWRRVDRKLFPEAIVGRNKFIGFVDKMMGDILAKGPADAGRSTVFSAILNASDPETQERFSFNEVGSESTTLVVAGADTTSTSMAATFFYLAHSPSSYARAADEVRSVFASAADVRAGPQLNGCVFLRACVDEAARLSPAVGTAPWRTVLDGGLHVDGEYVPGGCEVGVSIYSIQHAEDRVRDPFEFRPGRWLAGEAAGGKAAVEAVHSVFMPFSIGPRGCVGKGLAYMELMLTLAAVLVEFDFKLAEGSHVGEGHADAEWGRHRVNEYQLYDHVVSAKDGPMLSFRRRVCEH